MKCEYECPSWWSCDKRGCYMQAKANYAGPKNHRAKWETGSDYYMSGGALWYESTRGPVQLTNYKDEK